MAVTNKSKVSDVAKDFGVTSKDILAVLANYSDTPKKPSQVLEDSELNLIFEHLTQKNQVKIDVIFADTYQEKKETPKAEQKSAAPTQQNAAKSTAPAQQQVQQTQAQQTQAQQQKPNKSTATQQPATRVPEKKIVDTRKATNVNLDKYDEKLQDMAERSGNRRMDQNNKEKFRNAGKNKGGKQQMTFSNKRKQEEA